MIDSERSHIDNSIFLCRIHAKQIDNANGVDFPVDILLRWRTDHEEWVRKEVNQQGVGVSISTIDTYVQSTIIAENFYDHRRTKDREVSFVLHDAHVHSRRVPVLRYELVKVFGWCLEDKEIRNIDQLD